ncbi:universal stress protein [Adhaeribacter aerolatus]|nr:universal stress protein [Adhaeribacter aerolatus]
MKTILLPTDFSPNSANAAKYAAALTSQIKGKLLLVHVLGPETAATSEGGVISLPPDIRLELFYQNKLLKLSKQLRLDYGFLFELETMCVQGAIPEELNKIIQRKKVDLVVMGTKGANGFLEKLSGTTSAGFMKEAGSPVLIIPGNARFQNIKNITYASNFEKDETIFLQQLLQFTQPFSPAISILNIKSDDQIDLVCDNQILEEIQTQFPEQFFNIFQVEADDVVKGIHQFITQSQADILAVSIPGKPFLEELFHRSISRQLAYTSQIPLLALPARPFKLSAPAKSARLASQPAV